MKKTIALLYISIVSFCFLMVFRTALSCRIFVICLKMGTMGADKKLDLCEVKYIERCIIGMKAKSGCPISQIWHESINRNQGTWHIRTRICYQSWSASSRRQAGYTWNKGLVNAYIVREELCCWFLSWAWVSSEAIHVGFCDILFCRSWWIGLMGLCHEKDYP